MNIYGYTFYVRCPNNPEVAVEYTLMIEHYQMIMAELIKETCEKIAENALFQETVADTLAELIPGRHSLSATHDGVEVVTIRE